MTIFFYGKNIVTSTKQCRCFYFFFILKWHCCIFTSFASAVVHYHATGFPIFLRFFLFLFFSCTPIVSWVIFHSFCFLSPRTGFFCLNDYNMRTHFIRHKNPKSWIFEKFKFDFHDVF